MKIGDFVRFASRIVHANSHMALSNERGMVVSMTADKRTATVVWPDGAKGDYRVKNLTRTVGVIGHAARNMGEKRRPIKDRGVKPVKPPARVVPNPLPTATPDKYTVTGLTVKWYIPIKTVNDKGETKEESAPMRMVKILVRCKRSGTSWTYTGMGGKFSDSRVKQRSMTQAEFNGELAKYAADTWAVWEGVNNTVLSPTEFREMV